MTNAKDTFYVMLRDRLAALNPYRTMSLRGVIRPGILVEENELATTEIVPDIFRLRWTATAINPLGPLPLAALTCEIHYTTEGTDNAAGMDRGRLLSAMDSELAAALGTPPHHAIKQRYAAGPSPIAMATSIFWSDPVFAPATTSTEQLARVATVEIFSYQEAGE
jgi:hypothetical protein